MTTRRRKRTGFTLIEVMVSLGVMMVGSMAVIALQQQTVRANVHARELTIAMQIAQRWMERLKQDAHTWTNIATPGTVNADLAATMFLDGHLSGMATQPAEFKSLPITTPSWLLSNLFDQEGKDMPLAVPAAPDPAARSVHTYCASYRPAWIWLGHLMRVDVRVWWARSATRSNNTRPAIATDFATPARCGSDDAKLRPGGDQYDWYHVVYLPGAIRVNEVRR